MSQTRRRRIVSVQGNGAVTDPFYFVVDGIKWCHEPLARHDGTAESVPDFDFKAHRSEGLRYQYLTSNLDNAVSASEADLIQSGRESA